MLSFVPLLILRVHFILVGIPPQWTNAMSVLALIFADIQKVRNEENTDHACHETLEKTNLDSGDLVAHLEFTVFLSISSAFYSAMEREESFPLPLERNWGSLEVKIHRIPSSQTLHSSTSCACAVAEEQHVKSVNSIQTIHYFSGSNSLIVFPYQWCKLLCNVYQENCSLTNCA